MLGGCLAERLTRLMLLVRDLRGVYADKPDGQFLGAVVDDNEVLGTFSPFEHLKPKGTMGGPWGK